MNYRPGITDPYSRFLVWPIHWLPNERQTLLALTILAGGLCGLAAVAFHISVGFVVGLLSENTASASRHTWKVWTVLTPAFGGLLSGLGLCYSVLRQRAVASLK